MGKMMEILRKGIVVVLVTLLFVSFLNIFIPRINASLIIVPDDVPTIQAALDAAVSGTTIYVRDGVYAENVSMPPSLADINIFGQDTLNTVLDGSFSASLAFGSILIVHLTITGTVQVYNAYDEGIPNLSLSDCVLGSNISLCTEGSTIENNVIGGSLTLYSTFHASSNLNVVRNNSFLGSGIILNGLGEAECFDNLLTDNTIFNAPIGITEEGTDIVTGPDSWNNVISRNTIRNCSVGILSKNGWHERNTTISQNNLESNLLGVQLSNVWGMHLVNNNFVDNYVGLDLANVNITYIWGNSFLDNANQTGTILGGGLTWDNGWPAGGNYWSDYRGLDVYHGPGQDLPGADGIGDTPYSVGGNVAFQDYYPLAVANQRIVVSSTVEDPTPRDPWKYTITDASTEASVADFTLPAAGDGSFSSYLAPVGRFYSITQGNFTHLVEPIQGNVSAGQFYGYDTGMRSGFTPYMETGKSEIYLYEDTTTGALSLIIHHNKYFGNDSFWVNMTLNGLPNSASVLVLDDPTSEDYCKITGGGVVIGYWLGTNESDGCVLGQLNSQSSVWDITAQMLFETGIDAWEYRAARQSSPITLNMSEPLIIRAYTMRIGGEYVVTQHRKLCYETTILVNGTVVPTVTDNFTDMTLVSLGPGDTISVVFSNIPSAALGRSAGGTGASAGWTYNIPCRVPVPVQAAMGPDINLPKDGKIDLVEGKPTAIFVNVSDILQYVVSGEFVDISISDTKGLFNLPSKSVPRSELVKNNITIFYPNPPSIPGDDEITVAISKGPNENGPWTPSSSWVPPVSTIPTKVTMKTTSEMALYYACLNRTDYGTENEANYRYMFGNSTDFINATYPISNLVVDPDYKNLLGNQSTPGSTLALLRDCQWLAQLAKLKFPSSTAVGIGIGPNTTTTQTNYFAYHGATDKKGNVAVGVSFGPSTRGVVVMDGYYTAAAHELAHTFNLYYGVPEQYLTDYPGKTANGFNVVTQQLCMGYDFMGLAPYRTTNITWVNTASTFEYLFRNTTVNKNDPEILLVNGIIYQNGTVEFPLTWYHLHEGMPDTLPTGNFALRFVASDGTTILGTTSFDAPFFMQIDPGMGLGEDLPDVSGFGKVNTDFAGFSFATPYPSGTARVELVNMTNPIEERIIATVNATDIVFLPQTTETNTGTEGANGWYTSDVDVTLAATATSGVKEIHYTLDGTPNVVSGATATFTISTEGTHSLSYWAVDNSDNVETTHDQAVKIDKNPPTLELTLPQPLLHQTASATWTAIDLVSGVDGPTSGTVTIDTSSFGPKTVTVTAKDYAGNSITVTKTCYVKYDFIGFLEPINNDGSSIFKLGSTVPVKFQLKDAQGNYVLTAVARIYVAKITNVVTGDEVEAVSTSAATQGNLFRYDPTSNQYIFNLGTKPLSKGTWQIKVVFDDGSTKTVLISLR